MSETNERAVTLGAATWHLIQSTYDESRKREEKDTRYMKSAESYVEALLDFAVQRKQSEWKSRDKQAIGRVLQEALAKVVNGKPLTNEETKLIAAFREASQA